MRGGKEGVIVVWQLDTGKKKFKPRLGSPLISFIDSPDPVLSCISCADNQIHLLKMPTMEIIKSISGIKLPFSFPDLREGSYKEFSFHNDSGLIGLCADDYCIQFFSLFDNMQVSQVQICERNFQPIDDVMAMIFFSAHGVPLSYIENAGDPYRDQMEECVSLIMDELKSRGVMNNHTLAYQSRVGPVQWLKPYTDEVIVELGQKGVQSLLTVPISFVSEHIETLEEIDKEYKHLALESGITNWGRVPALGCTSSFISDLADAVIEAIPPAASISAARNHPLYNADKGPLQSLISIFSDRF